MSDKKEVPDGLKSKVTSKKKAILALVILGLLGGGYYGKLWVEAKTHGVDIKNLEKSKQRWKEHSDFYNNF